MNDRFKFRVWDRENKKFLHYLSFDLSSHGILILNGGIEGKKYLDVNDTDRYILMQCTGLKDKNGKLIYELDYVRYSNNKYKVEVDKFLGISLTNILNGDTIIMNDIVLFNCEVIGNEFESNTKI